MSAQARPCKDPRVQVTLKLTPGKHDALITWLKALPKGSRQGALLNVLLAHVCQPEIDRLLRIDERTAAIWQAFTELPDYLDQQFSRLSVAQPASVPAAPVESAPQLDAEAVAVRASKLKRATW